MSSQPVITIRLEIQIPTSGATPAVEFHREVQPLEGVHHFLTPSPTCPGEIATRITVIPDGSGGRGSIAASAKYASAPDPGDSVKAEVVQTSALSTMPSGTAVSGVRLDPTKLIWSWQGANRIGNAVYSSTGEPNYVNFWTKSGGKWSLLQVPFTGLSGGTGGHDCSTAGSGSGMTKTHALPAARTYPAVWLVAAGGFAVSPLVLFNATWALRQVASAAHPTWDNAADGHSAPRVQLKLCPTNGWELGLHFGDVRVGYALPFRGDAFGPLEFPERHDTVHGLGAVALPRVLISGV
jgi:hypothetical protein